MRLSMRMLSFAPLLVLSTPFLLAQTTADPSGHWEGTIQAPNKDVKIEIDLAKNGKGDLAGTFSNPARSVKGLPLATVGVDGKAITFELRVTHGGGTFHGTLLSDGKSMSGDYITDEGGYTIPFSLTRNGDAKIAPAPKSPLIGKELEGTWTGTMEIERTQTRFVLKMANHADGTSTGTIVSVDGGGVEIPIAMTQKDSKLTIDMAPVGASYTGVLNAAGTELVGNWTEGQTVLPLTFRRSAK